MLLMSLLAFAPMAGAEIIKPNENPDGGGHVVVCVGVNVPLVETSLLSTISTFAAAPREFCKAMAGHAGVSEVHLLVNDEANLGNILGTLQLLADHGNYSTITYVVKSLGIGGDTGELGILPANFSSSDLSSAHGLGEIDVLLDQAARKKFVILDVSFPASDKSLHPMAWLGPSADDWPSSTTAVISPAGRREQTDCGDRMIRQLAEIVRDAGPTGEVTMSSLRQQVLDGASDIRKVCPSYAPDTYGAEDWFQNGNLLNEAIGFGAEAPELAPITAITPMAVAATTQPLPKEPLVPAKKPRRVGLDTWLLGGATAVLGATCGVTEAQLLNNLAATETQADVQANFASQAEVDKHRAKTPGLGYAATISCPAAGATLIGAVLSGVF